MTLAVKSSSSVDASCMRRRRIVRDAVHIAGVTDTQPIHAIMLVAPLSVSTHGRRGGGGRGGGAGAEPGGKGGNGGEGGGGGEHAPK